MAYNTFPTVQNIIDGCAQDIRGQLASTVGASGQPILIDYTNRIHKQVLRFSNWKFYNSIDYYFITEQGQSQYWVGTSTGRPVGVVDTGLGLQDMGRIEKDSVVDLSNDTAIKWLSAQPFGPQLQDRGGLGRPGLPAVYCQDPNNPNLIAIYPPPDNNNTYQPIPPIPNCSSTVSGSLPQRTYSVLITFVDSFGNESNAPAPGVGRSIAANSVLIVRSPSLPFNKAAGGVTYGWYNVYASETPGSETLQNLSPIAFGDDYQEPDLGITSSGQAVPSTNNLTQMNGYIIKFRYYKTRKTLVQPTDFLQVPEDYKDIVIQGVNALAWKLLGKADEASACFQLFRSGLTEMVWDKNQTPSGAEFMRPDGGSYVNQQLMNVWPPFF